MDPGAGAASAGAHRSHSSSRDSRRGFAPDEIVSSSPERAGPRFAVTWKADSGEIEIVTPNGPDGCDKPAPVTARARRTRARRLNVINRYLPAAEGDSPIRSTWRPIGVTDPIPRRRIVRTVAPRPAALPKPASDAGSWPSFRGPHARGVADGTNLPDTWDGVKGTNVRWKTAIPGLAHSSPIVWGDRVYVTSAVRASRTHSYRPGLYGDGDASDDTSRQRWVLYAVDKRTGKIRLATDRARRRAA
jgi:hypothetical protein